MTIDCDEVLARVVRHYLDSPDFNGCAASEAVSTTANEQEARGVLEQLLGSRKLELLTDELDVNPHIKRFGPPTLEVQLGSLAKAPALKHVWLYPHADVLGASVIAAEYAGKPFALELALGSPQLAHRAFDLSVLEFYRNDPRYHYSCDDVHGSIAISNDYYESPDVPKRDQIFLETFGFAYNENFDRAVATFVRYLANLTAEHQQIWKAKQLDEEFKVHPDFFRTQILGDWPEHLPIFSAFWMELELINKIALAMGRPELFRNTSERPKKFAFLVRPTLVEFNDFVLILDKIISDNINRKFFLDDVSGEEDSVRADGKTIVHQKGTLTLLDEWVHAKFRMPDWSQFDEVIATFRKIRRLRQNPAHSLQNDVFDQKYFHHQRELMIAAYDGVCMLRQMFARHPAARGIEVHRMLREGQISDY